MAMSGSYDLRLVALSIVIAVFSSFAALDLAGRVTASQNKARIAWLIGGSAAMGLGIWSMHYIGMLAFSIPVQMFYDPPTVFLSLLAAILATFQEEESCISRVRYF
jgi:NO-binding membrane sensor protein with MHYT domain